jgi:hypothetical protein
MQSLHLYPGRAVLRPVVYIGQHNLCRCYCPLARIFHNPDNPAKGGLRCPQAENQIGSNEKMMVEVDLRVLSTG